MSNISVENTDLVDTIADAFFTWFQRDILPVCTAIFDILVIIIGVVLNILLIVTFKQRGLFNEVSSHIVFMLSISDFLSYVVLLLPNIITAIANTWVLSHPVCEIHGSMIFTLIFLNFAFVTLLGIERAIKLCKENSDLYEKLFESRKIRNVIVTLVWILAALVGFIPITGAADIKYDFYHQGCMLDYEKASVFLILHFLLTIVFSMVIVVVSYSLIFNTRRKTLIQSRQNRLKKENSVKGRNTVTSDISGNSLPSIVETDDDVFNSEKRENAFEKKLDHETETEKRKNRKRRPPSSSRQSLLFEVFSDDEENPAFHLAITYIALWGTIMVCYFPYVLVSFYGTFNDGPLWGGFYSVALLVLHTCFAVKPIVYLGHNRHYRHVTKQTIPEGVRNRARSMRTSVNSMSETVEDLIFRSNANSKFRAALATQKAVLIWKKRWQKKKGIFKLKEERNSPAVVSTPVIKDPAETKEGIKTNTHSTISFERNPTPDKSVTPSGILIQAKPKSSYIEEQRRKLLGSQTKAVHWGQLNTKETNDTNNGSPVPGMVNDNLADV